MAQTTKQQPTIKGLQRKLAALNKKCENYKNWYNPLYELNKKNISKITELEAKLKQRDKEMENSLKLQGDLDGKIKANEEYIELLQNQLYIQDKTIVLKDEQIAKLKSIVKLQSELFIIV